MVRCDKCGTKLMLPFRCNFCRGRFCDEHRLPENHACQFIPHEIPTERQIVKKTPKWKDSSLTHKAYRRNSVRGKKVGTAITFFVLIVVVLFLVIEHSIFMPEVSSPNNIVPDNPSGSSKVYSNEELVNYALILINNDRHSSGLENVTLSNNINSAQLHAESMLEHNFFSHWDMDGYKPHMRYTIAGGQGSVSENVAWMYSSVVINPKEALEQLEWEMVYNDSESNWGHKHNILTPFHNQVSIGIAYNDNNLYFVQDFENKYIEWKEFNVTDNEVMMKGKILKEGLSIEHIAIYYDNPTSLTAEQLSNSPFQGGYDVGTFVGMVLPSGWESVEGITLQAQVWTQTGQNFEIKFLFSEALIIYGKGVYNICLQTNLENTYTENNSLTSYSVWFDD